ncbi:hypothetical protein [Microbacterium testaceum]|uniref:hypothetical protein n=1 Tax=Microbacterium testaceum TaxID=2033 RepID=UPI002434A561|nr:hypothetical protein [Microbacterium testaceum]
MTGPWEESLRELVEPTIPWGLTSYAELNSALSTLKDVVGRVAQEPGIAGLAGDAAAGAFTHNASEIQKQIDYITGPLTEGIEDANRIRDNAREALAALPAGSMNGQQEMVVRGAAMGTTFMLGPISFLAGEGAVGLANSYLAQRREDAAQAAMMTAADDLDKVEITTPPIFRPESFEDEVDDGGGQGGSSGGGGGGGGRSGGRSIEQYPQWNPNPTVTDPGGVDSGEPQPEYHTMPLPIEIGPRPHGPIHGDIPIIDLDNIKPEPTPDGSIIGTPTLPGAIPSAPGGGLLGGSGGAGAGIGSGLGAGLIAGGGGAAALGSIARGAGAPGGSLFSGAGGTAASGAAGRSGGLLGKTAAAGSGLGTRGVGGMGGAAGGGAPAQSTAKGAGMRAGGVGGGGSAGGAAAGGGARSAGAGSRGVGGMGGPGSRSDRRDDASRGLGGPIAPRMEDDEEIGPRSQNAQAGGRDE